MLVGAEQRVKRVQTRERGPPLAPAEIDFPCYTQPAGQGAVAGKTLRVNRVETQSSTESMFLGTFLYLDLSVMFKFNAIKEAGLFI